MSNETYVGFVVGKAHYKVDDIIVEPHYQGYFYIVDCDVYAKVGNEQYKDYTYDYTNPIRLNGEIYWKVHSEPMFVSLDWELLSEIKVYNKHVFQRDYITQD